MERGLKTYNFSRNRFIFAVTCCMKIGNMSNTIFSRLSDRFTTESRTRDNERMASNLWRTPMLITDSE